MKTSKELEEQIARMQIELEEAKKFEAGILPEILQNFNPKNIRDVISFFESKENVAKYYKNANDYELKYGIDPFSFCEKSREIQFGDWVITVVDQQGGSEGGGEHWHCVFQVKTSGNLVGHFYIPGYYQSYDGTEIEWSSIYEVKPYEKIVIDWEKI